MATSMRPRSRATLWLVTLLSTINMIAAVSPARGADSTTKYSIAELMAALTDRLTSIHSLDCEYTITYGKTAKSPSETTVSCRSARSGPKWHYGEFTFDQQRNSVKENTTCFDGEFVWTFSVAGAGESEDDWSSIQIRDPKVQHGNIDPDELLGLRTRIVERSLPEIHELTNFQIQGQTPPGGRPGITLQALRVPPRRAIGNIHQLDVAVTLDPLHDFLPCEILITEPQGQQTSPGWENRWSIEEYRQVTDAQTKQSRWFPTRAVLGQGTVGASTITVVVHKIQLNEELPDSLFRPKMPDGVTLADATSSGRGRTVVKGGDYIVDRRMAEIARATKGQLGPSGRLLVLVGAALGVGIVIGLIVWRRYRFGTIITTL